MLDVIMGGAGMAVTGLLSQHYKKAPRPINKILAKDGVFYDPVPKWVSLLHFVAWGAFLYGLSQMYFAGALTLPPGVFGLHP